MNKNDFLVKLDEVLNEFESNVLVKARDEYEKKSFNTIKELLEYMKLHTESDTFSSHTLPKGYIARLAVESDPSLLTPDLGGRLIELEKNYVSLTY